MKVFTVLIIIVIIIKIVIVIIIILWSFELATLMLITFINPVKVNQKRLVGGHRNTIMHHILRRLCI